MTKNTKLTWCALLCALGVVLPYIAHLFSLGNVLLPMHLPVLLAGMLIGLPYSLAVGVLTPILSCIVTGFVMPNPLKLPILMLELLTYAVCASLFFRFFQKILHNRVAILLCTLFCAQIGGRLMSLLSTLFMLCVFHVTSPLFSLGAFVANLSQGLVGVALQYILLIPLMIILWNKRDTL